MKKNNLKTIIVLGMHRSGTSTVAGILYKIGINMGQKMLGKNHSNPLGYFEDKEFVDLNNRILGTSGGNWDSPPSEKNIIAQKNKFEKEIRNLVSIKNKDNSKYWGWKDPRTSLTIQLYLPYLKNPCFIVCHRQAKAVTESLLQRDRIEIREGRKLWEIYEKRIDIFFKEFSKLKRLDLHYENVIAEPEETVRKIIDFINLNISKERYENGLGFVLPKEEIRKLSKKVRIINLVNAGLRKPWKVPRYIFKKVIVKEKNEN
jgi:hypothetical protein